MENNNGRGVFYGVIGVATLVVTIIGATFAYFSASISSNTDAIQTNAANISLTMAEDPSGIKGEIVPVDEFTNIESFAKGNYIGNTASTLATDQKNCIDDDGNPFCSVYSFTVTNPSSASQKVYARVDVAKNTFTSNTDCSILGYSTSAEVNSTRTVTDNGTGSDKSANEVYCNNSNLAFAIFKGTPANIDAKTAGWNVLTAATTTYTATGSEANTVTTYGNTAGTTVVGDLGDLVYSRTAVPTYSGTGTAPSFEIDSLTQTLEPGGSVTYTVLVWLHETWTNQESDELKEFAAGVTFSTSQGGTGVTAVLGGTGQ